MTDIRAGLIEWLRTEFVTEQEAGFSRLKRVPDTQIIRFLDHFGSLDRAGQSALVEILVDWSSHNLLGTPPSNPIYEEFVEAIRFPERTQGLRYTGVNLLAGLAKWVAPNCITTRWYGAGAALSRRQISVSNPFSGSGSEGGTT